jgi:pimeloyl-ACP methyl ester carboxylesterase
VNGWVTSDDGTKLAVRRYGSGRPVVLVHPSAGGLDSFDPIIPLIDGHELWVYARRGYAPSDDCVRPKTFADDVADLRAVVSAARKAHVLGASYGATVVLHAARARIPDIRSLVLFEPPLFAAGGRLADPLTRYRVLLAADELAPAARLFAAEVARVPAPLLDAVAGSEDNSAGDRAEAVGCLHDLEAMADDTEDIARWAEISAPTLLMYGTDTWPPMPTTIDDLAHAIPCVTRRPLAGQAHFATHTAPALFAQTASEFLAAA